MALKRLSFFQKLLLALYFVGSFIGKFIFFLRPIFQIGDQNLALMLNEAHDLELNKIFEGTNDKKRYSSLLLSSLFVDAILVGLAVLLIVPFFVYGRMATYTSARVAMVVIMSVAAVLIVVLLIALLLIYSPSGFMAAKGVNLSAGDIMFLSAKASKGNKGKIIKGFNNRNK